MSGAWRRRPVSIDHEIVIYYLTHLISAAIAYPEVAAKQLESAQ